MFFLPCRVIPLPLLPRGLFSNPVCREGRAWNLWGQPAPPASSQRNCFFAANAVESM